MSVRMKMLQAARRAPDMLGESAGLVREFVLSQQHADGGFKNRSGRSDLYYTVFGIESLLATDNPVPAAVADYVRRYGAGQGLDFVHLCTLARCWASLEEAAGQEMFELSQRSELATQLEAFRTEDGGYKHSLHAHTATSYGSFLGFCAYQDLGLALPNPEGLTVSLEQLHTRDGAYSNQTGARFGATNATAAVVSMAEGLAFQLPQETGEWLLARCHGGGGFAANPRAPIPDLLSTATSLHALATLQISFESVRERCLDFLDSVWTNQGGFHASWADEQVDCEYTYYGLLALGHLSRSANS